MGFGKTRKGSARFASTHPTFIAAVSIFQKNLWASPAGGFWWPAGARSFAEAVFGRLLRRRSLPSFAPHSRPSAHRPKPVAGGDAAGAPAPAGGTGSGRRHLIRRLCIHEFDRARVGKLDGPGRIDEAGAELVVGPKLLGAEREDAAHVRRGEPGIALQHQRNDAPRRAQSQPTCRSSSGRCLPAPGTRMSTPGAAMATWRPRLAPENSLSSTSVAVTAITCGSAPG